MLITGKIKEIISSPRYAFKQWWIDIKIETIQEEILETYISGKTKLELMNNYSVGKLINIEI